MMLFTVLAFLSDSSDSHEGADGHLSPEGLGPIAERPQDFVKFHFWVQLEVIFVISMVFANMLALVFRFFSRTPLSFEPKSYE